MSLVAISTWRELNATCSRNQSSHSRHINSVMCFRPTRLQARPTQSVNRSRFGTDSHHITSKRFTRLYTVELFTSKTLPNCCRALSLARITVSPLRCSLHWITFYAPNNIPASAYAAKRSRDEDLHLLFLLRPATTTMLEVIAGLSQSPSPIQVGNHLRQNLRSVRT